MNDKDLTTGLGGHHGKTAVIFSILMSAPFLCRAISFGRSRLLTPCLSGTGFPILFNEVEHGHFKHKNSLSFAIG